MNYILHFVHNTIYHRIQQERNVYINPFLMLRLRIRSPMPEGGEP